MSTDLELAQLDEEIVKGYVSAHNLADKTIPKLLDQFGDIKDVMLQTLHAHQALIKELKQAQELIMSKIIEQDFIPYEGEDIEGVGFVEIHRMGDKKRTDNARIGSLIKRQLSVLIAGDATTGEFDKEKAQAVEETVDTMMELTGTTTESFNSWRKGAAKKLGIDINQFETREGGRLVVTIK